MSKILARFGTKILLKKSQFFNQDNIRFDLMLSCKNLKENLIRSCMDKIQARKSPRFLQDSHKKPILDFLTRNFLRFKTWVEEWAPAPMIPRMVFKFYHTKLI